MGLWISFSFYLEKYLGRLNIPTCKNQFLQAVLHPLMIIAISTYTYS